jgi:hypothetical protein
MDLSDAEMSRFVDTMDWDSNADDALRYINFYVNKQIDALKPTDENYAFFYKRYNKILNIANTLIGDPRFEFDNRGDLYDLFNGDGTGYNGSYKMLNQRAITDALMSHGYDKAKFLNWVDKYSKFLDKDKQMIHNILDPWVEPDVAVPNSSNSTNQTPTSKSTTSTSGDDLDGDFDSIFGTDGNEIDADLFGNKTSAAGQAAKVSAADAINRIKSFDFTL